jgi:type IV pilus assembly protein PilB
MRNWGRADGLQERNDDSDMGKGELSGFAAFLQERNLTNTGLAREDMLKLKGEYLGVGVYRWPEHGLDESCLSLIPESMVLRNNMLPVAKQGEILMVAMSDPADSKALQEAALVTGRRVRALLAEPENLRQAMRSTLTLRDMKPERQTEERGEHFWVLGGVDEGAPAVRLANSFFCQALSEGASDIHWEPVESGFKVRFRLDGFLEAKEEVPGIMGEQMVNRLKVIAGMDVAEKRLPQDGALVLRWAERRVDVRVSSFPSIYGEKIVTRIMGEDGERLNLSELGMREALASELRGLLRAPHGLILVCGPTGSGKTTTLYALLRELDRARLNIISLEDPVEYRLPGIHQSQINPRGGWDFPQALRAVLRQDPDVIMVGEIRDRETAEIAVAAALTGHLVLSTLHTNSAVAAPDRLLEMGVEPCLLAASLRGVIAQRLVRRVCAQCGGREGGCPHCDNRGWRGRVGLYEFLPITERIRKAVLARASGESLGEISQAEGMTKLYADGVLKASAGLTTLAEVLRVVPAPDETG